MGGVSGKKNREGVNRQGRGITERWDCSGVDSLWKGQAWSYPHRQQPPHSFYLLGLVLLWRWTKGAFGGPLALGNFQPANCSTGYGVGHKPTQDWAAWLLQMSFYEQGHVIQSVLYPDWRYCPWKSHQPLGAEELKTKTNYKVVKEGSFPIRKGSFEYAVSWNKEFGSNIGLWNWDFFENYLACTETVD